MDIEEALEQARTLSDDYLKMMQTLTPGHEHPTIAFVAMGMVLERFMSAAYDIPEVRGLVDDWMRVINKVHKDLRNKNPTG